MKGTGVNINYFIKSILLGYINSLLYDNTQFFNEYVTSDGIGPPGRLELF